MMKKIMEEGQTVLLGAIWMGAALVIAFLSASPAEATPIYGIRAANACDTCHTEPMGWFDPPNEERLCTMDCNGCHVNIGGGGLRTPSGKYYGRQTVPMWGPRPSEKANPRRNLPEGFPDKGRYRFFEGFGGWWPGQVPMEDVKDRFGDIDPDPTWLVGGDLRAAVFGPLEPNSDRDIAVFPMQADLSIMNRVSENIVVYGSGGLKGARNREDDPAISDYFALREAFVKVDRLKGNTQLRAGRFAPVYGWRLPDHTSFIRRSLNFDQNRQVFGVDASYNPNYLVVQGAAFAQGLEDWPGDTGDKGYGSTLMVGWRDLGWQVLGNLHTLQRDDTAFDEITAGVSWGFNFYPVVYLGEIDFRTQYGQEGAKDVNALFAYHELNWLVTRGLTGLLKYDWQDSNLDFKDDQLHRATAGIQFAPWAFHSLDLQYRMNFTGDFSLDTLGEQDFLAMYHFWY